MEWEKLSYETQKAYDWFSKYRDYGSERSLSKVCQKYTKKPSYKSQLTKWSKQYNWVERAQAYDNYMEGKKRKEQENVAVAAAKRHADLANKFFEKVLVRLSRLDPDDISPSQLGQYAEMAVKMEREALGMTEKYEVTQNVALDDKLADDLIKRSKELLERDKG